MIGNNQVRFGEGPTEKDHPGGTSLAAYSTFGCSAHGDVITFVIAPGPLVCRGLRAALGARAPASGRAGAACLATVRRTAVGGTRSRLR
jgi:hypothetical protein